jgi:NAD/NADP transhydrogenase alpha subunit
MTTVGVPRESAEDERRLAFTPDAAQCCDGGASASRMIVPMSMGSRARAGWAPVPEGTGSG